LKYGGNIRALDDPGMTRHARRTWRGKSAAGLPANLRLLIWTNPYPDKTIRKIRFSTDHPYASAALFGLSGVGGGE
jgi:hypothetical protein